MLRRISAAAAIAGLVTMLAATAALAGGWATIEPDAGTITPKEGEPSKIGFTILQHGVTPIDWEVPIVTLTNLSTGEEVLASTSKEGGLGHYVAEFTAPVAGFWSWQVRLRDLEMGSPPMAVAVRTVDGTAPAFDASMVLAAIEQARRSEVNSTVGQVSALTAQVEAADARVGALQRELADLEATTSTAPAETIPAFGIVILAALAGATAGFVMTWLAGRQRSVVTVSPATQGADPA